MRSISTFSNKKKRDISRPFSRITTADSKNYRWNDSTGAATTTKMLSAQSSVPDYHVANWSTKGRRLSSQNNTNGSLNVSMNSLSKDIKKKTTVQVKAKLINSKKKSNSQITD